MFQNNIYANIIADSIPSTFLPCVMVTWCCLLRLKQH